MSAKMNHEELVELLQEGKIGFLRFVMDSENADVEQTDIEQMDRQVMDDDSYGIWN